MGVEVAISLVQSQKKGVQTSNATYDFMMLNPPGKDLVNYSYALLVKFDEKRA